MTTGNPTAKAEGDRRIRSLDQFRGFTVLAMFAVNFLHGMKAIPLVFQHNENWFSLADWIMPAFLFTVGMSFRLTWKKRIKKDSRNRSVALGYVRRSLASPSSPTDSEQASLRGKPGAPSHSENSSRLC
jgi:predicted acyltransferase